MGLRADAFKKVDNYLALQERRVPAVHLNHVQNDVSEPLAMMMVLAQELGRMTGEVVDCVLQQREWFNQTASMADHLTSHLWVKEAGERLNRFSKICRKELEGACARFPITSEDQLKTINIIFQYEFGNAERKLDDELTRLIAERRSIDKKAAVLFLRNPLSHFFYSGGERPRRLVSPFDPALGGSIVVLEVHPRT